MVRKYSDFTVMMEKYRLFCRRTIQNSVSCEVYLVMKGQKSELDCPAVVGTPAHGLGSICAPREEEERGEREERGEGQGGNSSATAFARPNFDAMVKLGDEGLRALEFGLL